jgi:perosamine synthetase
MNCLDDVELSTGSYVGAFERAFAEYVGADHALSVSSGTTALHLALHSLGVGAGDAVIVPTLTFVATANAVIQTGATPIFADCDPGSWVLCPRTVAPLITDRTKAIIVAHLYGSVCDMRGLAGLAEQYDIPLVEDCAQALGGRFGDRHVGTWGTLGTFSFFGNKAITTGEGGMIVTNDEARFLRLSSLRNHASTPHRRYWHAEPGFNYKMTNLAAAIGLAQIERFPGFLERKRAIASLYRESLRGLPVAFQTCPAEAESQEWLFTLLLPEWLERDELADFLLDHGIDTRPVFTCMHKLPPYRSKRSLESAEHIARHGISLPSYPGLRDDDVCRVAQLVSEGIEHLSRARFKYAPMGGA